MKADNKSITEQDKETLKEALFEIFIKPSHLEYIKNTAATVNPGNLRKTYKGFHTFPKTDTEGNLEITMSNNYGEIQTPWFGESIVKDYYSKDIQEKVHIDFSDNTAEKVVIQLEVDTRKLEGWQEIVQYSDSGHLVNRDG